jgi:hypothetical protein
MNIVKFFFFSAIAVLIVGCSAPEPAKLSNSANIYLNKNILAPKREAVIQKNRAEFKSKDWTYTFYSKKDGNEYFAQNIEIKIKYLAAHSSLITLKADEDTLRDYIYYFKDIVGYTSAIDTVISDELPEEIVTVIFTKNRKDLK